MNKIIKNSKTAAKLQYISIIMGRLLSVWQVWQGIGIKNREDFGYFILATFGLGIIIIGVGFVISLLILLLSTIALRLNLHKPSIKRWKIARVLNLICIITFIPSFTNIILLAIIVFNIYIMFIRKPEDLEITSETENL